MRDGFLTLGRWGSADLRVRGGPQAAKPQIWVGYGGVIFHQHPNDALRRVADTEVRATEAVGTDVRARDAVGTEVRGTGMRPGCQTRPGQWLERGA